LAGDGWRVDRVLRVSNPGRRVRAGLEEGGLDVNLTPADCVEEKIVELHHAKRDLAASLSEGTDTAHTLSADELIDLLRNRQQ
jgi:hypothetical protein